MVPARKLDGHRARVGGVPLSSVTKKDSEDPPKCPSATALIWTQVVADQAGSRYAPRESVTWKAAGSSWGQTRAPATGWPVARSTTRPVSATGGGSRIFIQTLASARIFAGAGGSE